MNVVKNVYVKKMYPFPDGLNILNGERFYNDSILINPE